MVHGSGVIFPILLNIWFTTEEQFYIEHLLVGLYNSESDENVRPFIFFYSFLPAHFMIFKTYDALRKTVWRKDDSSH